MKENVLNANPRRMTLLLAFLVFVVFSKNNVAFDKKKLLPSRTFDSYILLSKLYYIRIFLIIYSDWKKKIKIDQ